MRLSVNGRGRRWQASTAIGAWRDFAELDLDSDAAIAGFVARFGDPAGDLEPRRDAVTKDWPALKSCLALFAQAWEPPDSDGISRITDDAARLLLTTELTVGIFKPFLKGDAIIPKIVQHGFALEFKTLGGFMIASASLHFVDRQQMRRCQVCRRWFPIRRRTARFCSAACIAQNARNLKHG